MNNQGINKGQWVAWPKQDPTHVCKRFENGDLFEICSLENSAFRDHQAQNAALIAAAPELLQIAIRLSRCCPTSEGLGGHAPLEAFLNLGKDAQKVLTDIAKGAAHATL